MPNVSSLDHLVLTVASMDATIAFYRDVLGMCPQRFQPADGSTRWALTFGCQKINLHSAGKEFEPKAAHPGTGTADLCFLSDTPLQEWIAHLKARNVPIEQGPVSRTGATGRIISIYLRDPDGNLIELANPAD